MPKKRKAKPHTEAYYKNQARKIHKSLQKKKTPKRSKK